jgi:hypothetical protein
LAERVAELHGRLNGLAAAWLVQRGEGSIVEPEALLPIEQIDRSLASAPPAPVAQTRDGYIYENPEALPRVLVVPEAQALDQERLIRTGEWPSTDFRNVVFVEHSALPLPRRGTGGTASISRYDHTEIDITVDVPRGGVLLLNDIWHPWWFAEVDGMPAKVLRANGIFRAVVLPRGAKQVTFRFEPVRGMIRRYLLKRGLINNPTL